MTDNRTTELLPCPFCGGEAVLLEPSAAHDRYAYHVGCNCGHCIGAVVLQHSFATEEEAIAAWNTRAELGSGTCEPDEDGCCPYCGEDLVRCDVGIGAGGGAVELDPPIYYNYCPNCGAKVVKR